MTLRNDFFVGIAIILWIALCSGMACIGYWYGTIAIGMIVALCIGISTWVFVLFWTTLIITTFLYLVIVGRGCKYIVRMFTLPKLKK